jgi:ferrous iron transport protein A
LCFDLLEIYELERIAISHRYEQEFVMQSKVKATRLSDLSQGSTAVIAAVDESVEQLMELGFVPGVHITPTYSGPGGEPRVYELEGSLVAVRRSAAHHISISLMRENAQEGK